ncbi:MAG TPA: DUF2905 family protein [Anaerohalosphaeraceae bacterium]|jgi:hypothetical protein|nr:DUF2905 family protein [Anaerohalosphaeraceae bacterium]HRT49117.1 DUF2905 family protein [Anaerohalosphaeraceae bacterium]HRT85630.1 DUF2905 family protein [Anaerohalosphaeraceae bacterium]
MGGLGKWLIVMGLLLVAMGAAMLLLGRIGLFRLPGDLEFGGRNWRVFIPITTSIILSILLTLLLWLITLFRR